jgi:hypothetical protein
MKYMSAYSSFVNMVAILLENDTAAQHSHTSRNSVKLQQFQLTAPSLN